MLSGERRENHRIDRVAVSNGTRRGARIYDLTGTFFSRDGRINPDGVDCSPSNRRPAGSKGMISRRYVGHDGAQSRRPLNTKFKENLIVFA
jgi:hypothetical protein